MEWLKLHFSVFLTLVSTTAPRGLQDVPTAQNRNDFCLELYLLLPLFLLLTAAPAYCMSSLCGSAAMTRRRRLGYAENILNGGLKH